MQAATSSELNLIRTAPSLQPVTRLELVSRSNPDDVRLELDTSDPNYDPDRTGIVEGSVSADVNREALRSLSLTLQDWSGDWFPGPGRALWLDAMLKVYRGYAGTQLWPQGVFEIVDPEASRGRQIRIQGVDKTSRANGRDQGGFVNPLELSKGLNIKTALETLAAVPTWNETNLNLSQTEHPLPYKIECRITDYPFAKAKEIAGIPGNYRPLHYDVRGYLTWVQDPDPNLLAPVWEIWPDGSRPGTAEPDEFSLYVEASKQIDTLQLRNWVGVVGGSGKSAPVYATASDADPNSATSVDRIGYRMHWWNGGRPDPLITTQEEAQARADYELRRLKQWHERVPLRIAELPILEPWDVIRVIDPDVNLNDTYQIVSLTLPLAGSAEMQLQGWRVRQSG